MNLDELQSTQSRERQTDSLQQLRPTFYAEAGEFIQSLRERRERVADAADDPFDAPEVNRLTDDINTAEDTVEAIYDRRVGKIVKLASLAAADMPTDDGGLTTEEQQLFDRLVSAIEDNRSRVLDTLDGESSPTATDDASGREATTAEEDAASPEPPVPPMDDDDTVEAADLMGGPTDDPPADDGEPDPSPAAGNKKAPRSDGGSATVERATVRITDDVGEIYGVDQREYDLSTDDVVTLPAANAEPLLDGDAAERLD